MAGAVPLSPRAFALLGQMKAISAPAKHSPVDSQQPMRRPNCLPTSPPLDGPTKSDAEVMTPMRPKRPVRCSLGAVSAK